MAIQREIDQESLDVGTCNVILKVFFLKKIIILNRTTAPKDSEAPPAERMFH